MRGNLERTKEDRANDSEDRTDERDLRTDEGWHSTNDL